MTHTGANQDRLRGGLARLARADKTLIGTYFALAIIALTLGTVAALIVALDAAGWIRMAPPDAFGLLTLHATNVFYYWLYFVQAGVMLALLLVYMDGARLTAGLRTGAWLALLLMCAGWVTNVAAVKQGAAVLAYVVILLLTGLADLRAGKALDELPSASFTGEDASGQRAWFGTFSVVLFLVAMYLVTGAAYWVMSSLPVRRIERRAPGRPKLGGASGGANELGQQGSSGHGRRVDRVRRRLRHDDRYACGGTRLDLGWRDPARGAHLHVVGRAPGAAARRYGYGATVVAVARRIAHTRRQIPREAPALR